MHIRLELDEILEKIRAIKQDPSARKTHGKFKICDVLIAGSGPIGAGFARKILEDSKDESLKVIMCEIGAQDGHTIGGHQKNTIKYQKDIDLFVNVIKGALQKVSVPPPDAFVPNLGGEGWKPGPKELLVFQGNNPSQNPRVNLQDCAVTRTVGGMATHWTCACPLPHPEERSQNPIEPSELDMLLEEARKILNVHEDQYDDSIRNTMVKEQLTESLGANRPVRDLPLAVERRKDNPAYVTWSGTDTVFGKVAGKVGVLDDPRFELWQETRVTKLYQGTRGSGKIDAVQVRRLGTDEDVCILPRVVIIACGAVGTPQILANSDIDLPESLGCYLTEQSIAFCQIVLKREIIEKIRTDPRFRERVEKHKKHHPLDPLPIPFSDPEPQVSIPYSEEYPWHTQIHRDAFNYGDVGPRADPRVVVDLRFFGKQDARYENCVWFTTPPPGQVTAWQAGITDIYGMPQATFCVTRSPDDEKRDQRMMADMTKVANLLGSFLPGSEPQFMNPGLALHITGTTRIGKNKHESVADPSSRVHGYKNLWVGGNNCIPDSTACNPTLTSLAIALKAARSVVEYLESPSDISA